ncbi:homeobox domain-containing protein [Pilaira anomala]|nr:homeobox domain-containing protein [Pilaira anomala]
MSDSTPPLSSDDSKKRTRVTPSQLTILEETFSVSATPDSKMRKQLAFKLQMPERSIQIWFQNRRAKVKMLQRRVLLRQEQEAARARLCAEATSHQNMTNNNYWFTQQQQQQQQAYMNRQLNAKLPIHRAWSTDMMIPPPPPPPSMFQYPPPHPSHHQQQLSCDPPSISITGPNDLDEDIYSLTISPSPTPQSFTSHIVPQSEPPSLHSQHSYTGLITATAVTIGSWHRMKISQQDLMCYYKLNERTLSWHIRDSNYHFKMMISFDSIASIELNVLEDNISAQIDIDLIEPPIFFMENGSGWVQCSDFTEGMQASVVLRHTVRGLAVDLRQELVNIAGMDERLCQITRFPAVDYPTPSSIEQALLMSHHQHQQQQQQQQQQNWRHQSVPLTKEYWIPPTYPI